MDAQFIRQDEMREVRKKATTLLHQQLVDMATTQAFLFTPKETHAWPCADFDMEYFTEVMVNLFKDENLSTVRAILNGEDLRWFGDDEDFK
jgi:hypothetical protein